MSRMPTLNYGRKLRRGVPLRWIGLVAVLACIAGVAGPTFHALRAWQRERTIRTTLISGYTALLAHRMPAGQIVLEATDAPPPGSPGYDVGHDSMGSAVAGYIQYRPPAWDSFLKAHFATRGGIGWNPQGAVAFVGQLQAPGQSSALLVITATPFERGKIVQIRVAQYAQSPDGTISALTIPNAGFYDSVLTIHDVDKPYAVSAGQADPMDPLSVTIALSRPDGSVDIRCTRQPDGSMSFSSSVGTVTQDELRLGAPPPP